jgi:hypothetical protein
LAFIHYILTIFTHILSRYFIFLVKTLTVAHLYLSRFRVSWLWPYRLTALKKLLLQFAASFYNNEFGIKIAPWISYCSFNKVHEVNPSPFRFVHLVSSKRYKMKWNAFLCICDIRTTAYTIRIYSAIFQFRDFYLRYFLLYDSTCNSISILVS